MNWVDDDPCECCGSRDHLLGFECPLFNKKYQAIKERELQYLIRGQGYRRTDYENLQGPSSCYPYYEPPPPPNYQECYYPEMEYHYEQERGYNNYEPEMPHFPSYREEYDDYYNEYPQPAYEESPNPLSMKLDALMNMMKELKKENEVRDKAHEALVIQVGQLVEEVAQIRRDREMLASGTMIDGDVVEEVMDLPEQQSECSTEIDDITLVDWLELKEAQDDPYLSLILTTSTNKCGDESSGIRIRKVVFEDIGQFVKRRPQSCSIYMPLIIKNMWMWHVSYRAYIGNAVGKCALRPP